MHEEHPDIKNDLSKSLFATTGLQQSSKDEPEVVAPWHLTLVLKHCASAAANACMQMKIIDEMHK